MYVFVTVVCRNSLSASFQCVCYVNIPFVCLIYGKIWFLSQLCKMRLLELYDMTIIKGLKVLKPCVLGWTMLYNFFLLNTVSMFFVCRQVLLEQESF